MKNKWLYILFVSCIVVPFACFGLSYGETEIDTSNEASLANLNSSIDMVINKIDTKYEITLDQSKVHNLLDSMKIFYSGSKSKKFIDKLKKRLSFTGKLTYLVSMNPASGEIKISPKLKSTGKMRIQVHNPTLGIYSVNGQKNISHPFTHNDFEKQYNHFFKAVTINPYKQTSNFLSLLVADAHAITNNLVVAGIGATLGVAAFLFGATAVAVGLGVVSVAALGAAIFLSDESREDGHCSRFTKGYYADFMKKLIKDCDIDKLKAKLLKWKKYLISKGLMNESYFKTILNVFDKKFDPRYVQNLPEVSCHEFSKAFSEDPRLKTVRQDEKCFNKKHLKKLCQYVERANDCHNTMVRSGKDFMKKLSGEKAVEKVIGTGRRPKNIVDQGVSDSSETSGPSTATGR
ncbi:MAG: hypothetical protein ISR65_15240 [Bacteriovoracaceae bacterium]|nr:hypothetical protein [Bacteriovoracaceae bacterium]